MEHGELTVQQGRWRSVVMTGLRLMQRVALSGRVCVHPGLEWCIEVWSWAVVLQCDRSNWIIVRSWTWSSQDGSNMLSPGDVLTNLTEELKKIHTLSGGVVMNPLLHIVKSRSTPVGGPVKSRWKRTRAEVSPGQSCDRLDSTTRTTSVDPLRRFRSGGDRDGDWQGDRSSDLDDFRLRCTR